ncbi:hypothetical protein PAMC26577_03020 [Caballeronia sordidicola]|uniref:DUF433 domain-containing protein n=2 Tax=Caballeronia sordidicola TaxID=196367 RepID=A0A242N5D1_CABSO|nr:hypothetical protein PAMC26577_03020 [Caballeronia sordidicola]
MAGLTDKEINRLVDDEVLPTDLVLREHGRRFAPLTAPFANFYFFAGEYLTRAARIRVIATLMDRLRKRPDFDLFLALSDRSRNVDFDWSVTHAPVTVLLAEFVHDAWERAARVSEAARHVVEDPEILGGTPCFAGTRVPVATVVAAAEDGKTVAEQMAAYPFLTLELIEDAAVYVKARPRAGRPRRVAEVNPELTPVRRKVVRPAREEV